jgi:hypothetical protein
MSAGAAIDAVLGKGKKSMLITCRKRRKCKYNSYICNTELKTNDKQMKVKDFGDSVKTESAKPDFCGFI